MPSPDITAEATRHRQQIDRCRQEIGDLERERDIAVRQLEAEIAHAEMLLQSARDQRQREMAAWAAKTKAEVELRQRLIRSSQAALASLEPNQAEREAPMQERQVPRPETVTVPIKRHADIRS